MRKKTLLIPILIFSFASAVLAETSQDLPLFFEVNDWLYRSAQPTKKGLEELKAKGVRTVINFRDEPQWQEREKNEVEALGMTYVSLPWSVWKGVKPELLDQLFEVLDRPENRPALIHCQHGRDRTNVMTVLSLMRYEKLTEDQARKTAFGMVRPHLQYWLFVNWKIRFFLSKRLVSE